MPPRDTETPMMDQYKRIKTENADSLLFFRLGDFYELFFDDAKVASKELDLVLTGRPAGKGERVPMCGVPYHSCEAYIARLIAKGYKIAICEQTEDPAKAKGLVRREIVRNVTPGTVTDASMLDEKRANYIACVYVDERGAGAAFADVSTGEFLTTSITGDSVGERLFNEISRFAPREALLSEKAADDRLLAAFLTEKLGCVIEREPERFEPESAAAAVEKQFGETGAEPLALLASGALAAYLRDTQRNELPHMNKLRTYSRGVYMELGADAVRNLEVIETMMTKERRGSLLWVLDRTVTSMGSRMLRGWVEKPLVSPASIRRRQKAVAELCSDVGKRTELTDELRKITDIERLMSRVVYGSANCRDLRGLAATAGSIPKIKELLAGSESLALLGVNDNLDELTDLRELIERAVADEPPFSVREGGFIRDGYDEEVDRLRYIRSHGREIVAEIESRERERTGIKNLKVGYNKVFGYYIELSRSNAEAAPPDYIRKQTLANGERYITEELKKVEGDILSSEDRLSALEYELFGSLRETVQNGMTRIQATASAIAECDALCSLADVAERYRYVCPEVTMGDEIEIKDGRHPVVERMTENGLFVPNDTRLNCGSDRVAVLTGPNMAGKSTYMRQVALIVLMAQIGSFVPAESARIGVVDRIFTRVGASDDLASGRSTFMVEMSEVSDILKNATRRSLLILDEIGRGTSTFDGMAIARAVLEYVADKKKLGAKTLFATHYHELTALENTIEGIKNYNISVKRRGGEILFLRKIIPGGADGSYGVDVARLAGLPEPVIKRAREILAELESGAPVTLAAGTVKQSAAAEESGAMSFSSSGAERFCEELARISPDTMTPIEALTKLYEIKERAAKL